MEPWNTVLHKVVMERWDTLGPEEQRVVVALIAADHPVRVVRAMDYTRRLAEEVAERIFR